MNALTSSQAVVLIAGDSVDSWSHDLPELERVMNSLSFPSPAG